MKTVSTELTRASKEIMAENSVNRVPLFNEGKLDRVSFNQVHSVAKGFLQVCSVNQASIG